MAPVSERVSWAVAHRLPPLSQNGMTGLASKSCPKLADCQYYSMDIFWYLGLLYPAWGPFTKTNELTRIGLYKDIYIYTCVNIYIYTYTYVHVSWGQRHLIPSSSKWMEVTTPHSESCHSPNPKPSHQAIHAVDVLIIEAQGGQNVGSLKHRCWRNLLHQAQTILKCWVICDGSQYICCYDIIYIYKSINIYINNMKWY